MAITEYYVDPAINANSGTGTIGDPFGDLQYALDTVTRDTTNGDRFNVKAGTAEVLAAALSLATYGTPTATAPLVFQGYTSAAGDGGIGEISGAGSYTIYNATGNGSKSYITFADMKVGNCGGQSVLVLYTQSSIINCEIYGSSASVGVYFLPGGTQGSAIGCYFHSLTGADNIRLDQSALFYGNYVVSASATNVILMQTAPSVCANNLIVIDTDTSARGIASTVSSCVVINNTIYSKSANTLEGIFSTVAGGKYFNNTVVGFSGTGGTGIKNQQAGLTFLGANAFFNNATNVSDAAVLATYLSPNISLASAPFIDAANGDYKIDGDSDASAAAWPQAWKGLATTANAADIGAVQSGAGSGGGVSIYTRSVRVIKG